VLHELTLRIATGERVAIVGPNGCGKSTLLKLLTRELYPLPAAHATMRVLGRERWNVFDLRRAFGIVSGDLDAALASATSALDVVVSGFFATHGTSGSGLVPGGAVARARTALERMGVGPFAERPTRTLSSGQARRVAIARALAHEPRTLVLDEPTTALDLRARAEVLQAIRELPAEVGVLLVTHDLAEIDASYRRVIAMREGRFASDGTRGEMLSPERIGALFDVAVQACPCCGRIEAGCFRLHGRS